MYPYSGLAIVSKLLQESDANAENAAVARIRRRHRTALVVSVIAPSTGRHRGAIVVARAGVERTLFGPWA